MREHGRVDCPFCGKPITVNVMNPCGKEPKGSVSISHTCPSGLFIEWFEKDGMDTTEALEALKCRAGE